MKKAKPVKCKLRKGDNVLVIAGKDKGKRGNIMKVLPEDRRVVVSGVNVIARHQKPSQMSAGGIVRKEAPIHVSNVAMIDPKEDKATRVGFSKTEDGAKVRVAKRSGEIING